MKITQIFVPQWIGLSQETREKLRQIFNIKRSVQVEVVNNVLISDGSTDKDLSVMTAETMRTYLKSKEKDFVKLFNAVSDSLETPKIVEPVEPLGKVKSKANLKSISKIVKKSITKQLKNAKKYVQEVKPKKVGGTKIKGRSIKKT
jgi:hypothetical protein